MTPAEPDITHDAFLGGRLTLAQPRKGFRAGSDAVLLAAAIPAMDGTVIEAGCGAGAAMLCLARRVPGVQVTGLEVQADMAALAEQNIIANDLPDRARVVVGDIAAPPAEFTAGTFDHGLANPPFFTTAHDRSPLAARALARTEGDADTLARWIGFLQRAVRQGGTITLIHRAERLEELQALLPGATILPLLPRAGQKPKRVLVRAINGGSGVAQTLPGFVLHDESGYTAAAQDILRHGQALVF